MSAGSAAWTNYTITTDLRANAAGATIGLRGRVQSPTTYYQLNVTGSTWSLQKVVRGLPGVLAAGALPGGIVASGWHTLQLGFSGASISAAIDATPLGAVTDSAIAGGMVGIRGVGPFDVDNVRVQTVSGSTG
jgi:hypothetical protein